MDALSDITRNQIDSARQAANLRLHLLVTAETTRMISDYGIQIAGLLSSRAGEDGVLDVIDGFALATEAESRWGQTWAAWGAMFEQARTQAGAMAYGALARAHQIFMGAAESALQEQDMDFSPVFDPQLRVILNAARERLYDDGYQLSQRLWRIDRDARDGIRRVVLDGVANGDSAWNIGKNLEVYLGADAGCPRWTSTRLYGLTPAERMDSGSGLIARVNGSPCETKGVAYNALRLARNEIQVVHNAATDEIFQRSPWVTAERVVLSPDHPPIGCECEAIVIGGEEGDGVYPVGEILLPVHVQCMCYKEAVLMEQDEFTGRLRGWMTGAQPWAEMDAYGNYLGVEDRATLTDPALLLTWGPQLLTWLWGNKDALNAALGL